MSDGTRFVVSGRCSLPTNLQVLALVAAELPALAIDPLRPASGIDVAAEALGRAAVAKWPGAGVLKC